MGKHMVGMVWLRENQIDLDNEERSICWMRLRH